MDNKIVENIAIEIANKFVFNLSAYGKQIINEKSVFYNTYYNTLDSTTVLYMINNKKAFLTYQQNMDKLKWICFDFDINKMAIAKTKESYNFFSDNEYKPKLLEDIDRLISYLKTHNIKHTLEYSGNRGVHVWIFFKTELSKKIAFQIEKVIQSNSGFKYADINDSGIEVDLFPKNGISKGNRVGKGVKLPLSFHLKSCAYSYLINTIEEIEFIDDLTDKFLTTQLDILNRIEANDISDILNTISIKELDSIKEFEIYKNNYATLKTSISLDEMIKMLRKCKIYEYIFSKNPNELSEKDRTILVGTLVRLKTQNDDKYGENLLLEIFKLSSKYDEELSKQKIDQLRGFFPPTIDYLQSEYNIRCDYCSENHITYAYELIDNIDIEIFTNNYYSFDWTKKAEQHYLSYNDECNLNFIRDELNSLDTAYLSQIFNDIKGNNNTILPKYYIYERNEIDDESNPRIRTLYSLSARDRVLTTYATFWIRNILDLDRITNSYGYRLNSYPYKYRLFESWNKLWMTYVREIDKKISSESYADYYFVKLDIRKFYNNINYRYLSNILYQQPQPNSKKALDKLNDETRTIYNNVCEYLIKVSKSICGEIGVPQGPAYARYLAELYLSPLDHFILEKLDGNFDHYFRYVDDIVLIVKDKERAELLYNNIPIFLSTMYLEKNDDKCMNVKISEIQNQNIMGKNTEKYFIDSIDEIEMPEAVEEKIKTLLNDMFYNQEDINIKDMPFFLTHLVGNTVNNNREAIIKKMVDNNVGRGSMFKHFYKKVVFRDE